LIAEKLGIVGRATEDGSLGWKLLLQHVADDAKGASGNLAGKGWRDVPGTGDDEFSKGCSREAIEQHFSVPGRWFACGGRRGCRVSLIQLNRWRIESQCFVERRGELLSRLARRDGDATG
jgi:hypothetical protein